jgi:hypothetical protein
MEQHSFIGLIAVLLRNFLPPVGISFPQLAILNLLDLEWNKLHEGLQNVSAIYTYKNEMQNTCTGNPSLEVQTTNF